MDFCSDIYHGCGFFGGYPNAEQFDELLDAGVGVFVDLTTEKERRFLPFVYPVVENIRYINFPIMDNQVPKQKKPFLDLVYQVAEMLKKQEKVYIHCKGGHGRSGVIVASILCYLYNIPPEQAIRWATIHHSRRPNLKAKWKGCICPQMFRQQQYVMDLFTPVHITYHDYHKWMREDPGALLAQLGLRPLTSDISSPILRDLMYYIRDTMHQSKKIKKVLNK
jgi:protein-tyrosine phosphatase